MTLVEPLPADLQWGKGDWQDYINNWREKDAEWIQARTILRYETAAKRTTDWGATPSAGMVTYNHQTETLEMYRAGTTNAWVRSLMFQNLNLVTDTTSTVKIGHSAAAAGGKGLTFTPTNVVVDMPFNVMSGMLQVDATSVGVQSTSQKLAKLTTNATELVSDTPLAAASLRLSGTGTVLTTTANISVGAVASGAITATGNITATGQTISAAVVTGVSGTIGQVSLAANVISTVAGSASANAAGLQSGQGYFYGDGSQAVMRQRASVGVAAGAANVAVTSTDVILSGTLVQLASPTRVLANRSLEYATTAGTKYGGPVIWGADPGVANVPEGTIWVG
jgi:hypothetical protein